jgi:predicted nucleic acid-binding protein
LPISEVVIADSSPFIHLERIGCLDLLPRVFGHVEVPATIADEVSVGRAHGLKASDLRALPWITVRPDVIDPVVAAEPGLHAGEVTALSLARGTKDHLLIVDDRAARDAATKLHLRFIGTAGVVIRAKRAGIIASAGPTFDQLSATGFRLSIEIRKILLAQVGE